MWARDGRELLLLDDEAPHRADYVYLAVWKTPTADLVKQFEASVDEAGFHDYFEQVNARGELVAPDAVFGHMIGLWQSCTVPLACRWRAMAAALPCAMPPPLWGWHGRQGGSRG